MADESRNTPTRGARQIVRALKSLDAKATTGAGSAFNLGAAYSGFGVELIRAAASTASTLSTAASVQLQGRVGSTKWRNLGSAVTVNSTAGTVARSTNPIPVHDVRLSITSFTTGAAKPAITGWVSVISVAS